MKQPGLLTVIAVICVCWSSMNTFLYCYFGNLSTESFLRIPDWLYASKWYNLINDQQKFYIMMIANSQRSLFFHGFGLANLTLETYSTVFDFNEFKIFYKMQLIIFISKIRKHNNILQKLQSVVIAVNTHWVFWLNFSSLS